MSSEQTPAGRPSPQVYRRRRLLVLLGVVAVIVAIVLIFVRPGASQGETSTASPAHSSVPASAAEGAPAEESAEPSEPPPADGAACEAKQIVVEPVTDQSSYAADEKPELSVTLVNIGENSCVMNAGTAAQVFTIKSGDEVYWTSTDCQTDAADAELELAAGESISSSAPLVWERTRSTPDTCDGPREMVPAGGAAYNLSVSVDGFASTESRQFLLY